MFLSLHVGRLCAACGLDRLARQDKLALALDKKAALILNIPGLVGHSKSTIFSAAFYFQREASIAQSSPHYRHLFCGCDSQAQHGKLHSIVK
jgi:hypothetical protein